MLRMLRIRGGIIAWPPDRIMLGWNSKILGLAILIWGRIGCLRIHGIRHDNRRCLDRLHVHGIRHDNRRCLNRLHVHISLVIHIRHTCSIGCIRAFPVQIRHSTHAPLS